ncbi:MAG: CDP-alcohol phosphatidyltransferase family protein [Candidatus Hodarchaeales archaeon]|jgi:CDP-L-myo-inositol myo-inositolphosphotransferase
MKTKKEFDEKITDGFISRHINRKLSRNLFTPLILRIYKKITPNQVSLMSFIISVFSSVLFFLSSPLLGGVVVQLSSVLDGCDGEIARYKKMTSKTGNFLDAFFDRYADFFVLSGVFYYVLIHVANKTIFGLYFTLPLIVIISVLAIFGMLMSEYMIQKSIASFNYDPKDHWIFWGRRDLRLFAVFIGGVLAHFNPIFLFFTLVFLAIETNFRSIGRFFLTFRGFQRD